MYWRVVDSNINKTANTKVITENKFELSPSKTDAILLRHTNRKTDLILCVDDNYIRLTSYDDAACSLAAATLCEGTDSGI